MKVIKLTESRQDLANNIRSGKLKHGNSLVDRNASKEEIDFADDYDPGFGYEWDEDGDTEIQIQDREMHTYEVGKGLSKSPKVASKSWGRIWKGGKLEKQFDGSKYEVRQDMAKYLEKDDLEESHTYGMEPSSIEYGEFISSAKKSDEEFLKSNNIDLVIDDKSFGRSEYTYSGNVNNKDFKFIETHQDFSKWPSKLIIDGKEVNLYKSKDLKRRSTLDGTDFGIRIRRVVDLLNDSSDFEIVYKENECIEEDFDSFDNEDYDLPDGIVRYYYTYRDNDANEIKMTYIDIPEGEDFEYYVDDYLEYQKGEKVQDDSLFPELECMQSEFNKLKSESKHFHKCDKLEEATTEKLVESNNNGIEFSAFITNLGKYNEGELDGVWVDFPIDEDDFEEKLKEIGIGSTDEFGQPYEEWFVTDYECNYDLGVDLGEHPSYEELNEQGELLSSVDNVDALAAIIEHTGYDLEQAINLLNSGNVYFVKGNFDYSDVAQYDIDNVCDGDLSELGDDILENFFDYEALGRDIDFTFEDPDFENVSELLFRDPNRDNKEDIGHAWVDMIGVLNELNDPYQYLNLDAYGRYLVNYGGYAITSDGLLVGDI